MWLRRLPTRQTLRRARPGRRTRALASFTLSSTASPRAAQVQAAALAPPRVPATTMPAIPRDRQCYSSSQPRRRQPPVRDEASVERDLDAARRMLKDTFGFESLPPEQEQVLRNLLAGGNAAHNWPIDSAMSLCCLVRNWFYDPCFCFFLHLTLLTKTTKT